MLSITCLILIFAMVIFVIVEIPDKIDSPWLNFVYYLILSGIFLPIPVALLLNLRDWLKTRKS